PLTTVDAGGETDRSPLAAVYLLIVERVLISVSFFSASSFQNELYFASVRLWILVFKSQFFSWLNWLYGFYVVN
ncbi:hypothetical protein JTL62_33045, partial [Pseudomonas aeruginosa]|nr:hypothetical protein [Pseudomonas aeruginosa]